MDVDGYSDYEFFVCILRRFAHCDNSDLYDRSTIIGRICMGLFGLVGLDRGMTGNLSMAILYVSPYEYTYFVIVALMASEYHLLLS